MEARDGEDVRGAAIGERALQVGVEKRLVAKEDATDDANIRRREVGFGETRGEEGLHRAGEGGQRRGATEDRDAIRTDRDLKTIGEHIVREVEIGIASAEGRLGDAKDSDAIAKRGERRGRGRNIDVAESIRETGREEADRIGTDNDTTKTRGRGD